MMQENPLFSGEMNYLANKMLEEGLAINGDNAAKCDKEVEKWLRKVGLK